MTLIGRQQRTLLCPPQQRPPCISKPANNMVGNLERRNVESMLVGLTPVARKRLTNRTCALMPSAAQNYQSPLSARLNAHLLQRRPPTAVHADDETSSPRRFHKTLWTRFHATLDDEHTHTGVPHVLRSRLKPLHDRELLCDDTCRQKCETNHPGNLGAISRRNFRRHTKTARRGLPSKFRENYDGYKDVARSDRTPVNLSDAEYARTLYRLDIMTKHTD